MDVGLDSRVHFRWRRRIRRQRQTLVHLQHVLAAERAPEKAVVIVRQCRIIALVVLAITGSIFWAIAYLLMHPPFSDNPVAFPWDNVGTVLFLTWLEDPGILAAVASAMTDVDNPHRFAANKFLMESVVIQMLSDQSRKGLPVPAATIILFYLQCWEAIAGGELARQQCAKLQGGMMTYRKNWLRRFRARWHVAHGPLRPPSPREDDDSITQRAQQWC